MSDEGSRSPTEPRFVADAMLGRLARWLRLLGFDVIYRRDVDDVELARIATRDARVLLSRDRGLLARRIVRRGLLVTDADTGTQLRQVLEAFDLRPDPARRHTVCPACNGRLREADPEALAGRVPPFVLRHHRRFAECPSCGRVYWEGTKTALEDRALAELLGSPEDG